VTSRHVRICVDGGRLRPCFNWEHAMTRRGPSRRRLSGSLRHCQGSALRAAPFGADGLDRASSEPTAGSYVMAPLDGPVECGTDISIARCRELLGAEAESMTDQDVAQIRRHAETMAWILVEMYEERRSTPE
jgi:hypothetical protein